MPAWCLHRCSSVLPRSLLTRSIRPQARSISHSAALCNSRGYYEVLGIHVAATQAEVKTAFYNQSKVLHPDVNDGDGAEQQFIELTQAYRILGDVELRKRYDKGLSVSDAFQSPTSSSAAAEMRNARRKGPLDYNTKYNFEEFYRKHYAEALQYEQTRRRQHEELRKQVALDHATHRRAVLTLLGCLAVGIFMMR